MLSDLYTTRKARVTRRDQRIDKVKCKVEVAIRGRDSNGVNVLQSKRIHCALCVQIYSKFYIYSLERTACGCRPQKFRCFL